MRQLRVPAGLKPRRMPLRHQSVTVRCGICKMAATCSGVRTSVGVMCCNVQRYRFTVKHPTYMYLGTPIGRACVTDVEHDLRNVTR